MEFNVKSIEKAACPPSKNAIYFADPTTRGLYIQITKFGAKTFVYRRKIDGTWRQKKIAEFGTLKIPEVRVVASDYTRLIASGTNIFEKTVSAEPTLLNLFEEYVQEHAIKKCTTVGDMEKNFVRWFASMLNSKANKISHDDAEKFHARLGASAPYAANRAVQLARAVYNHSIKKGKFAGTNPFAQITLFDERTRNRFLSNEEAGRLFRELEDSSWMDHNHRALRDFILIDVLTGSRKTALVSAEWDEFDLNAGTWSIPPWKSKNKKGQLVPLGGYEISILQQRQEYLKEIGSFSRFIFPGSGKTGHQMDFKRSWPSLRRRLGLEDVTIHDLRRSLAATMASANVNLILIKNALNHSDLKTTAEIYARTNKQAELEAKQKAHSIWLEAASATNESAQKPDGV